MDIGERAINTSGHYFDLTGSFELGRGSCIAGFGSQFWTHGAGVTDRNIKIGKDCYIGSAVRFSPDSSIGDYNIVPMASVLTKKYLKKNLMIGGHPAKILRENYNWKKMKYHSSKGLCEEKP